MPFIASLIFILLLYIFPLRFLVLNRLEFFPFLGRVGSFLLTSIIIYFCILLILYLLNQFREFLWPNLPYFLKEHFTRRTGIYNVESLGFYLAAVALIFFLAVDWTLIPLSLAALVGFGWLLRLPIHLRPVGLVREVKKSPEPLVDYAGAVEETTKGNLVVRKFDWQLERPGSEPFAAHLEIAIDVHRYQVFAAKNPYRESVPTVHNYKQFVVGGITDEVNQTASSLLVISNGEGFSPFEEIANVHSFVQAVPYSSDQESKGKLYWRYPIETLYEQLGDDNCRAILLAALLKAMNYNVLILESADETAVAVAGAEGIPGRFFEYQGRRYFYCSVSKRGQKIGQIPANKALDQFKAFVV